MNRPLSECILAAVARYLEAYDIHDENVVCAFSGGADSVSLLWALDTLREKYRLSISALHVNHGIRGEEATRDERFCKAFCRERNIAFRTESVDAPAYAQRERVSLETAARILRYEEIGRAHV